MGLNRFLTAVAAFSLIGLCVTNIDYIYRTVPFAKEIGVTEILQVLEVVLAVVAFYLFTIGSTSRALFVLGAIPLVVATDITLLWLGVEPLYNWGEPFRSAASSSGAITIRMPNRYWNIPLLVSGIILICVAVVAAQRLRRGSADAQ